MKNLNEIKSSCDVFIKPLFAFLYWVISILAVGRIKFDSLTGLCFGLQLNNGPVSFTIEWITSWIFVSHGIKSWQIGIAGVEVLGISTVFDERK